MLDSVLEGIRQEFADLPDLVQATKIVVRLLVAAFVGGILGLERESSGKSAGIRTHMLVAMGSAFCILAPQMAGMPLEDTSRIIQGVMAGIGSIGAGTILKQVGEGRVEGLTTAAGIWLTAALGIAAGMGREATAVLGALLALLVLYATHFVPRIAPATKSDGSERH